MIEVETVRNAPRPPAWPRLGDSALEALARPCVEHLFQAGVYILEYLLAGAHPLRIEARGEACGRDSRNHCVNRTSLGQPLAQTAVQYRHVRVAEDTKCPPHPRGPGDTAGIVEDDPMLIADAERLNLRREKFRRRQHMRQMRFAVCDRIDNEKHCARNVCG